MTVDAPLATPAARHTRARILDLAHSRVADADFLGEVSRQLRRIIPFTSAVWCGSDPLTALAVSPLRLENVQEGAQCARFWEREHLVPDFNLFRDLARAARPTATLTRATGGQPERSQRYRELRRDQGFGDELRGVFRSGGGAWGFVSLWRGEAERPFSAAEERLLADLSQPVAEAFRHAALLRTSAPSGLDEAPGLLVFDPEGALTTYNDQAALWLSELPPPMPGDDEGFSVPLPTEVRSVIAMARAIAAGVERGPARTRIRSRHGRWLVVHGFQMRGVAGATGTTAVVIEPAAPTEVAPILMEACALAPREQQIIRLLARGYSTAEIAAELSLSEYTVRDYVKSLFEKVGVSSRGELVARIFAEHHQEPLRRSLVRASLGAE